MGLIESFLSESAAANVWVALRSDLAHGNGSASDPYHGGLAYKGV